MQTESTRLDPAIEQETDVVAAWLNGELRCFFAGIFSALVTILLVADFPQITHSRPTWLNGTIGLSLTFALLAILPAFTAVLAVRRHDSRFWYVRRIAAATAGVAYFVLAWLMTLQCYKLRFNGGHALTVIHGQLSAMRPAPISLFILACAIAIGLTILSLARRVEGAIAELPPERVYDDSRRAHSVVWLFIRTLVFPLSAFLYLQWTGDVQSTFFTTRDRTPDHMYVLLENVSIDQSDLSEGSPVRLDGEQIGTVTHVAKSTGWRKQIRQVELTLLPGRTVARDLYDSHTVAILQSKPFLFGSDYVELLAGDSSLTAAGSKNDPDDAIAEALDHSDMLLSDPVIAGIWAPGSTEAQLTQSVGRLVTDSQGALGSIGQLTQSTLDAEADMRSVLQETKQRVIETHAIIEHVKALLDTTDDRMDRIEYHIEMTLENLRKMLFDWLGGRSK